MMIIDPRVPNATPTSGRSGRLTATTLTPRQPQGSSAMTSRPHNATDDTNCDRAITIRRDEHDTAKQPTHVGACMRIPSR
jgi:hypothetical protein